MTHLPLLKKTYVNVNIFDEEHRNRQNELEQLPTCCADSAEALQRDKEIYLKNGVFSEAILDWIIDYHRKFDDKNLRAEIGKDEKKILELVTKYFHCG